MPALAAAATERTPSIPWTSILRGIKMDGTTEGKLDRLLVENLGFLVEQLTWKDGYSDEDARAAVEEYRKFVALSIVSEDPTFRAQYLGGVTPGLGMPSKHVDQVWHRHILFTREYPEFCARVNGEMIHHEPCTKESVSSMTSDETERIYNVLFGQMPTLWFEREDFLLASTSHCRGGEGSCRACKRAAA